MRKRQTIYKVSNADHIVAVDLEGLGVALVESFLWEGDEEWAELTYEDGTVVLVSAASVSRVIVKPRNLHEKELEEARKRELDAEQGQ